MTAVVQAMRRMEERPADSGHRRTQMMEECRRVLGAASMAFCHHRQDGELVLRNIAGAGLTMATVREIVRQTSLRPRKWFSSLRRGESGDLALAGRASDVVCAVVPPGAAPWVEDFVAFVAERFIRSTAMTLRDGGALRRDGEGLSLPPGMIAGPSPAMRELLQQLSGTVSSGLDVLLSGETGTGKELLARLIHGSEPIRNGPFVAINCAAIPGDLLEAELFGVQRRVATGVDPRAGLFVEADGGTIFLDEIAELPERLQAKLLRVLQEREVLALGATRPRKIAVRIISASNQDLPALVSAGRFRADLYYRLRSLEYRCPPLRCRSEDIPQLALEFMNRASEEYGKLVLGISSAALELLQAYPWPGNIRELQTEVRRAVLLCPNGESLGNEHFALQTTKAVQVCDDAGDERPRTEGTDEQRVVPLRERIDAVERAEIERALQAARGNRSLAARMLGITRNGLSQKVRRLGLNMPCE